MRISRASHAQNQSSTVVSSKYLINSSLHRTLHTVVLDVPRSVSFREASISTTVYRIPPRNHAEGGVLDKRFSGPLATAKRRRSALRNISTWLKIPRYAVSRTTVRPVNSTTAGPLEITCLALFQLGPAVFRDPILPGSNRRSGMHAYLRALHDAF